MRNPLDAGRRFGKRVTLALGLVVALTAMACTGDDGGATNGGEGGGDGQTLVIAAAATPTTLDPEFSSSPQDREIDVSIYDRFTQFQITESEGVQQADLNEPPVGLLAEDWEVSDDGLTYTFNLREGVQSYEGNELTADDVIWSWDRVFAQESQGLFPLNVSSVEEGSYEKVDDYTVRVTLTEPNPLLPIVLATPVPGAVIYDSTAAQEHATDDDEWAAEWLATNTASFGPYHAVEYSPGQQVIFEANPNYFQGEPAIERIIYREIPDPANRLALLQSGDVDVAADLNAQQRQRLEDQSGVKVVSVPGNLMVAFGVHNQMEPFDDERVRQAVAYAMPIEGIIDTVYFDDPAVRLFEGYVADTFPGYPEYWPYQERDVERAEELLDEAGADDVSFELSYTTTFPEHERIAQLIRTGLGEIGIDVVLNRLTPARYQEQYYTHQAQAVLVQDAAFVADAAYPLFLFFGAGDGAVGNWIEYENPEVQDAIAEALGEPDLERRVELGREANRDVIEDVPWPMHLGIGYHVSMREEVEGFTWRPHNLIHFYDLSKSE